MASFKKAHQAEIIRSNQKDEYYMNYIKNAVTDLCQQTVGMHRWLSWRHELDLAADTGYFLLTTLAGFQTLGEEYVNIVQVDESLRNIPNTMYRALLIFTHVALPYILDRLLRHLESQVHMNEQLGIVPEAKERLLQLFTWSRKAVTIIHRCHLALFYLKGTFYHAAKRLIGIRYLLVRQGLHKNTSSAYRWLGWLSVTQLLLALVQQTYTMYTAYKLRDSSHVTQKRSHKESSSQSVVAGSDHAHDHAGMKCPLCLGRRQNSTVTVCGHLFCWDCIMEWCTSKAECPLCREPFDPSRLVCLQNYDAVKLTES